MDRHPAFESVVMGSHWLDADDPHYGVTVVSRDSGLGDFGLINFFVDGRIKSYAVGPTSIQVSSIDSFSFFGNYYPEDQPEKI
ncbi:MAG: hypothetical protein WC551_08705 [Patescibacteria group bacterium]